jgi:hypothetical protein
MKRVLIGLMVLILALSLAGAALAAGPPKAACLTIGAGWGTLSMVTKKAGNVTKASGKVTLYNINAEFVLHGLGFSFPMVGTGHLVGTTFHFNVSGGGFAGANGNIIYSIGAQWDTANPAAQTSRFRLLFDAGDTGFDAPFAAIDCAADNIPYDATGLDPLTGLKP